MDDLPDKKSLTEDFDDSAVNENLDDSKAKFLPVNGTKDHEHNEPHVVVDVGSNSEVSFTGLGKEDLMKFASDPFWVRTRMILFVAFWVCWIAMLVAAILIIVFAPKCPERPNLKWYQTDVIYQVNPKSFKDTSNKDTQGAGTGDIKGITDKLDYLTGLGVNTFWINSLYKSGGLYDGNDVEDHTAVDALLGTMEDVMALRKTTRKKGMRMVMDFIPNHTGKKHEWFIKSENKSMDKDVDYTDFYIWADGTGSDKSKNPPNNWVTEYGTTAWTYSSTRGQWYYHSYLPEYPDLNLRNEDVLKQLDGVLRFWLDKGIDGFAVQGVQRLVEMNDTTHTEPEVGHCTTDIEGNMDLVKRWRAIIDSYSDKPGRERALIAYVKTNGNNTKDYHTAGIHIVLSDVLVELDLATCDQACVKDKLEQYASDGMWRGWMVDNENSARFGSRVDKTYQKAIQALHMLLPGTAVVYYGDEIAMANGVVPAKDKKDPLNDLSKPGRDEFRTPMLWNSMPNAGFCNADVIPWLPINGDYEGYSVEYNTAHKVGFTMIKSFKKLVELRAKEAFQFGTFDMKVMDDDILYFTRTAKGFSSYIVAFNRMSKTTAFGDVADTLTLAYDSMNEVVGQTYNMKEAPIGFQSGEVYVFSY